MSFLIEFWLPIMLSAVGIFIASSVVHMVLPMHSSDNKGLPGEPEVLKAMRDQDVTPGTYMFPFAESMKSMADDDMIEKYQEGPVGFVTVLPSGMPRIGRSLLQWFIFTIFVSAFVAYVLSFALAADATYLNVFRIAGTVAFLTYGVSGVSDSIWKGQSWWVTFKFGIDGLIYALVTAGIFGTFAA